MSRNRVSEDGLRVALVNLAQPPGARTVEDVLAGAYILVDWAEALAGIGLDVTAIQGCATDASFVQNGVRFELVSGPFEPFLYPYRAHGPILDRLVAARPDVVHMNSLLYGRQLHHARKRLPDAVHVFQNHAERPFDGFIRRTLHRRWLRAGDAFVWNGLELAAPWRAAQLLPAHAPDHAIAEGSARFSPASDRHVLRRDLGIDADPLILWLGRLDANKDPATVLAGLQPVLEARPRARALFCYKDGELEAAVAQRVASDPVLAAQVELRGPVPHATVEALMQSADVLVQGSYREGSSFALLEALASGVIPVMTDIPSIRFLTGATTTASQPGAYLWPPGDADALQRCLEAALAPGLEARQKEARGHFERTLAYPVLAKQMSAVYDQARRDRIAK